MSKEYAERMGFPLKKVDLKPGAIPTLHMGKPATEPAAKRPRLAAVKREYRRVSVYVCNRRLSCL